MYITVMRVEALTQGRGINIFLHLPPGPPDPANPWKVVDAPGPRAPSVAWAEIKPGGNRVEAYLDLFFEERDYTPELLGWALGEIERRINVRATNPAKMELRRNDGVLVYAVFSVNLGLDDLMSKHRVFQDLSGALLRWEAHYAEKIRALRSGNLRAAG